MPILKSAKKAMRRDEDRRSVNDRFRRVMREQVKAFQKLLLAKDVKAATTLLPNVYQAIDKAAKSGVIKKNTADRKKSRMTNALKKLA